MKAASLTLLLFHAAFAAAGWFILRSFQPPLLGVLIGAWVLAYNVSLPWAGWLRGHPDVIDLWTFLLPLSLLQVIPDWVLAGAFNTLAFPDVGGARLGPVPAFMAGLWVVPLVLVIWITSLSRSVSERLAPFVAAASALAIFGAAEWAARPLGLWYAHGVRMVHGVALYVLPAETVLGVAAWRVYQRVQGRLWLAKLSGAATVSVLYTGSLVTALFLGQQLPG